MSGASLARRRRSSGQRIRRKWRGGQQQGSHRLGVRPGSELEVVLRKGPVLIRSSRVRGGQRRRGTGRLGTAMSPSLPPRSGGGGGNRSRIRLVGRRGGSDGQGRREQSLRRREDGPGGGRVAPFQ